MPQTKIRLQPHRYVATGEEAQRRRDKALPRLGTLLVHAEPVDIAWLERVSPKVVTPAQWYSIKSFVTEHVATLMTEHGKSRGAVRQHMTALTVLAAHLDRGQSLNRKKVLHPDTIDDFAAATAGTAGSERYVPNLRHIGELLNPEAPWERAEPVGRRSVAAPYAPSEVAAYLDQIERNKGIHRRRGLAMSSLCFGAGLEGRCATTITTDNVIDDGHGLMVATRGRIVPVLRTWEPRLRAVLHDTPPGGTLIGDRLGSDNAANYISHHIALDAKQEPLMWGRARSTWIVTHLTMGTRLDVLMEAAGLTSITTINDLLEFVPHYDTNPAVSQARARQEVR